MNSFFKKQKFKIKKLQFYEFVLENILQKNNVLIEKDKMKKRYILNHYTLFLLLPFKRKILVLIPLNKNLYESIKKYKLVKQVRYKSSDFLNMLKIEIKNNDDYLEFLIIVKYLIKNYSITYV